MLLPRISLGCLLLICGTQALSAQVGPCRTNSDSASVYIERVHRFGPDSAPMPTLVTDSGTCARAVQAFEAMALNPDPDRTVYVLDRGTAGYVVIDPRNRSGEWLMYEFFDCQWHHVISLGG